jgi:hypothetical protein
LQKKANRIWKAAAPLYGAAGTPAPKIWQGNFQHPGEAESVYSGDDGAKRTGVKFGSKLAAGLLNPNSNLSNTAKETLLHEWEHQYQDPRPVTAKNEWEVEGGAEAFARQHAAGVYKKAGIDYHNPKFNGYPKFTRVVRNKKGERWINKGQEKAIFSEEGGPKQYDAALKHNAAWAKPSDSNYQTALNAKQEKHFRGWLKNHREDGYNPGGFDPNAKRSDYDLRGDWLSHVQRGKLANLTSGKGGSVHFSDRYKTPYDATFSRWSEYAKKGTPLVWRKGNRLVNRKTGRVVFKERSR